MKVRVQLHKGTSGGEGRRRNILFFGPLKREERETAAHKHSSFSRERESSDNLFAEGKYYFFPSLLVTLPLLTRTMDFKMQTMC